MASAQKDNVAFDDAPNGVDYWRYSAYGSVPFEARKLRGAQLVWINLKWFFAQGVDVTDATELASLKARLLRDYAFVVPRPEDPEEAFTEERKTFFADRYGEMGMIAHGGSGRAGSWKNLQIKGVGVTPLVGTNADWLHAHGCMWMEEAIREVVYAQLFDSEFPHGTVPVVAIIDTGLHAEMPKGRVGERRALVLRPTVFRVAHLLRATFFESKDQGRLAQQHDASRTKEAIRRYQEWSVNPEHAGALTLEKLHQVAAESMAFGEIFRLSIGGLTASTLSLLGQLIDFGSARALPDWRRAEMTHGLAAFGSDASAWSSMLRTLCYLLNKHGLPSDATVHRGLFLRAYQTALARNVLKFWGLVDDALRPEDVDTLVRGTMAIFRSQQREAVSYLTGDPYGKEWIHDDLRRLCGGLPGAGRYRHTLSQIWETLSRIAARRRPNDMPATRLLLPALRHSCPRHAVYREGLQKALFADVVPSHPHQRLREGAVDDLIATCLSLSRRFFASHIHEHIPAVYADGNCTAVRLDRWNGGSAVRVRASTFGRHVLLGRHFVSLKDIGRLGTSVDASTWEAEVPASGLRDGALDLATPNVRITIPMSSWMDDPM